MRNPVDISSGDIATEGLQPSLVAGLFGFDAESTAALSSDLGRVPVGGIRWRAGPFQNADAWLVNGAHVQVRSDDEVEVADANGGAPLRLLLREVDRPIAFAEPIGAEHFEPACAFDPDSPTSLTVLLSKFTRWLRPNVMLLQLADVLVREYARLRRSRVYHLTAGHRLVAVVDLRGEVGVSLHATAAELAHAQWHARPSSAGFVPETFARRSTRMLMWEYASHASRDVLPQRYHHALLYLRAAPLLPQSCFSDCQLFVLRELTQRPATLDELCSRSSVAAPEVVRALMALYLVGSITSSPARAKQEPSKVAATSSWPGWLTSQLPQAHDWQDATVPGAMPAM